MDGLNESNLKLRHSFSKHQFAIIFEMKMALKTTFRVVSLMLWIKYSSCLHWIVLICYKLSEGFCFNNLYSILMYRDKGRELLRKFMEFLLFNIHRLREIYCLFKLKSSLELIINQF